MGFKIFKKYGGRNIGRGSLGVTISYRGIALRGGTLDHLIQNSTDAFAEIMVDSSERRVRIVAVEGSRDGYCIQAEGQLTCSALLGAYPMAHGRREAVCGSDNDGHPYVEFSMDPDGD